MNYYNRIRTITAFIYFVLFWLVLLIIKLTNFNHAFFYIIAAIYFLFCAALITCVLIENKNKPKKYENLERSNIATNI